MIDFQVAFDKLAQFETPGEIAKYLESCGIRACRRDASACAISQWMRNQTGLRIRTNYAEVGVLKPFSSFDTTESESHTPAMSQFARNFDSGDYPDLEMDNIYSKRY